MSIPHVELTDTFDTQRRRLNAAIDVLNGGSAITPGNGLTNAGGVLSVKKAGDGLSFDSNGALVGNDAYANLLTQVLLDVNESAPTPTTITSTTIVFPAFSVLFADNAFYGKKISDYTKIDVPETTMTLQEGVNGAVYVYVNTAGQILQSLTPIDPSDSATKCLLGSYFRLSNTIQAGSWAYTPWNGATSKDLRTYEGGNVKGGLIQPSATLSLSRTSLTVLKEGVNVSTSIYDPNNIIYQGENPYSTKELWPGYDPTVLDSPTLDTTHIYNITSQQVVDISSRTGYIVLVPGIVTVTGQDVYLMAMSPVVDGEFTQIFNSIDDAIKGIYSLQVSLGTVASRVSWLGQSIVVKIAATDYTDPNQLRIVGEIPNVLGSGSNYPGAAGAAVVQGLTIKNSGEALLPTDKTDTLDFTNGIVAKGISETEAKVGLNTTNCVTHIRSSVDIETENNTVIVKSGTVGYIPDGYEYVGPGGDEWTTPITTTPLSAVADSNNVWRAFAYNGSLYVAISTLGYISTSTDGLTWTTPVQNVDLGSNYWADITWDGTKFIAIGQQAYISTSTDGLTWTTAAQVNEWLPQSITNWGTIGYNGSVLVVVSGGGRISTSSDGGTTWTTAEYNSNLGNHNWAGGGNIAWNGSKFVMLGITGYISTSTDGTTWTNAINELINATWYGLAWDGTKFVAIGYTGSISTSTDGITWTTPVQNSTITIPAGLPGWNCLIYDGDKFLSVTNEGWLTTSLNVREGEEYTSTEVQSDITNISCPSDDSYLFVNGSSVGKAVAINNVYVDELEPIISSEGVWFDLTTNLIKYTNDGGSTWTAGYSLPLAMIHNDGSTVTVKEEFNGHGSISGMAFALPGLTASAPNGYDSNKLLVNRNIMLDHVSVCQVYPYETICLNEAGLISTANIKYSYEQNLNLLNGNPSDYAIIGITNEDTDPRFKNIFRPIDYYDIQEIEAISYHPDLFDCKWSDKILNNPSWVRGDTFSWQSGEMYKAAYNYLLDEYNNIPTPDLSNWAVATQNANLGNNYWYGLVYNGSKYVALGNIGYISTSTDGITWTTATQNANLGGNNWQAITYSGSKYVALSQSGYISTSTDGTTWTTAVQNANLGDNYWSCIIFDGTKFVAIGYTGSISTSTDGITWTAATQNANLGNNSWESVIYADTKFIALSLSGYISTSTDGTTWTAATQNANLGNNSWHSIIFDGSKYVALGYDGYISTSTDGTTWTTATQNANLGSHQWYCLVYSGSKYVALGASGYISYLGKAKSDTISGVTVTYYLSSNGMKICLPDQEANVADMYTATGSAWYYILDPDSQQFKLPRKHSTQIVKEYDNGTNWYRLYADGWVEQGGTATTVSSTPKQITLPIEMSTTGYIPHIQGQTSSAGYANATWQVMPVNTTASPKTTTSFYGQSSIDGYNLTFTWSVSGQSAIDMSNFQADQKYRYFYVGEFTLPALRNTAGVTTEVLNNKVDRSQLQIVSQLPAQLVEGVIYFVYGS